MQTSPGFIPICYVCHRLMNLGEAYYLIGDRFRAHAACLKQWQIDDPQEWEGMPSPLLVVA